MFCRECFFQPRQSWAGTGILSQRTLSGVGWPGLIKTRLDGVIECSATLVLVLQFQNAIGRSSGCLPVASWLMCSYLALTRSMNGARSFRFRRVNAAQVRLFTWSLSLQSRDWSSTILFLARWSAWNVALISSPLA